MAAAAAMADLISMRERLALLQGVGAPVIMGADAPGGRAVAKRRAPASPKLRVVPSVPAVPLPLAAPPNPAPARPPFDWLRCGTIAVAVVLAVVAASFSVAGMARIFPGAELPVTAMAITMEAGKLAGAAWLSHRWRLVPVLWRFPLALLIGTLALINAMGVFGQLSEAHRGPAVQSMAAIGTRAAVSDAEIDKQATLVADLSKRIAQSDATIDAALSRGRLTSSMEIVRDERRVRQTLVDQRSDAQSALVAMKGSRARISGEHDRAAADLGVLQYAADFFGLGRDKVMQILILLMVMCCDPLSITLVVVTARDKPCD
jgi:hypothetical protein